MVFCSRKYHETKTSFFMKFLKSLKPAYNKFRIIALVPSFHWINYMTYPIFRKTEQSADFYVFPITPILSFHKSHAGILFKITLDLQIRKLCAHFRKSIAGAQGENVRILTFCSIVSTTIKYIFTKI